MLVIICSKNNFISKENPSDFTSKFRNYVVDSDLPQLHNYERLQIWWNKLFETKLYLILSSIVRASLSIFTWSMVESSFSWIRFYRNLRERN